MTPESRQRAGRTNEGMGANLAALIRTIGGGPRSRRDLPDDDAQTLFAAMLADEVPALELGAILVALRLKGESLAETQGFLRALDAHTGRLVAPADTPRTVVLPTYNGARRHPNLTALLALLLARFGVPVLMHGLSGGDDPAAEGEEDDSLDAGNVAAEAARFGRVTTADVLRELGIAPAASMAHAQEMLVRDRTAYVPIAVLAPGLAALLACRTRLGIRSAAHSLAKLIDPFGGASYRVVSATHPDYLERMRALLGDTRADAMLLRGTEGEPFANPLRTPLIEDFAGGVRTVCTEGEAGSVGNAPPLPAAVDAPTTAAWIARVLAGEVPVPAPIVAQLACCMIGARRPVPVTLPEH